MPRKCTRKSKKSRNCLRFSKKFLKREGNRSIDLVKTVKYTPTELEDFEERNLIFNCDKCDTFYKDQHTLDEHFRTKGHKRRLKSWDDAYHTTADAEKAAGLN